MSAEPQDFSIEQAFEESKAEQSATTEPSDPGASPPSPETAPPDEATAAPPDAQPASESPDLISDAEYQALKVQHKDDPDALVKALKGAYTKKTQALADERKSLESVKAYQPFITALVGAQTNEERAAVLRQAATELGVDLSAVASPAAAPDTAQAVSDSIADTVAKELGPDYEFMADPLSRAIKAALDPVFKQLESLSSVESKADAVAKHIAEQQVSDTMAQLTAELPDWKEYEQDMVALGLTAKPGESALDYAKRAYRIVTLEKHYDKRVAADVKKHIEQMNKAAKSAERQTPSAPSHRVAATSTASTIDEMWEEAKNELATR
jgi:hypothetical protein